MAERALRVATRPPQFPAEGTIQLVSHDNGLRWVVKMKLGYKLEAARVSEWAKGDVGAAGAAGASGNDAPGAGDIPDTEYAFVGDTEQAAFARAEAWLHERYDVRSTQSS